jgi:hypothetical protein
MRNTFASFFGWAGLALAVVASGALIPGSTVVSVPDTAVVVGTEAGGGDVVASHTASLPPVTITATPETPAAPSLTTPAPVTIVSPARITPQTTSAAPEPAGIAPSPVLHVQVPAIDVDADVLPVDSKPTGRKNAWGGDIYSTIDFPVDEDVRQWVRRGDPNSLPAAESAGDVKAFDRVLLYGHASDIGNHLVFQDLVSLKAGDSVIATTALGRFTYEVTAVYSRAKTNLNSLAALYDYPADGRKELALIACLPDTTSNVVVLTTLVDAQALPD